MDINRTEAMDREIPPEEIRRQRVMRTVKIAAVVVAIVIGLMIARSCIAPSVSRSRILTSLAEIGSVTASLSASGVVVPESEQIITSPIRTTVERILHYPGDTVSTGESIVQLNTETAEFEAQKLRDELAYHRNQKRQFVLGIERKTIDLESSRDIQELEVRFAESQLNRVKRLREIDAATDEALLEAQLTLDIAKRRLQQVVKSIENQKAALEAEIDGLDLQIRMKMNETTEAERDLELARICARQGGVVTWVNTDIGAHVSPGEPVARVADLGSFKIEGQISDIHAEKLRTGGEAVIRIGDLRLDGTITTVRPTVESGVIKFDVTPHKNSDPSLRPNMRVDVFVITSFKDSVLRVDNGPFYRGRVRQSVFVISGDRAERREVDIGASNYDAVELIGDIHPGDEVIVSDMSKYEHADEVMLHD